MDNLYKCSDISELIKDNFIMDKKMKLKLKPKMTDGLNGLMIIYAPWCSYCVSSKNMWINMARLFKYKFKIYAFNSYNFRDSNNELTIPLDIRTYPVVKFIRRDGSILNYRYDESESEITKFIIKNS